MNFTLDKYICYVCNAASVHKPLGQIRLCDSAIRSYEGQQCVNF